MRVERVRLRNFKCYGEVDVSVDRGVTVIYGPNGSGKSSLLEASFFALYGAKALTGNLEDVIRNGTEEAEVEVWFAHAGGDYHVERRIRLSSERAQTATCILETPDGTIEGARDVRTAVAEIVRMDAEAFVNCAYVRQGEVNKLINATPKARREMLDDLLQLGTLKEYRKRAGEGRLAVERLRERWEDRLDDREDDVCELEGEDLHDRLNDSESELAAVEEKVERFEENRERARETLTEAASILAEYEERREELAEVEERIEEIREKIAETETEREALSEEIERRRETRAELADRIESLVAETDLDDAEPAAVEGRLATFSRRVESIKDEIKERSVEITGHEKEVERHDERAEERAERAGENRDAATEFDDEAEGLAERAEQAADRIEEIDDEIDERRAAFEDAPIDPGGIDEHVAELREALAAAREREAESREALAPVAARIEEAEALLAEGKCPECGQPVDDSPHVDAIGELRERKAELVEAVEGAEADREELEERAERAESLQSVAGEIDEREAERERLRERRQELAESAAEKREAAEEAREGAADLESAAEEAREAAKKAREAAASAREALGDLNTSQGELREQIERVETLAEAISEREEIDEGVERRRERRADLSSMNDERRENVAAERERKERLESAYDEERVENAREDERRAEDYLERVEAELDELGDRRDDLVGGIKETKGELDRLEELREERAALKERVGSLASLHEETEALEGLYGDLRTELRKRNIASLERLLNETFDLVYGNDAYARIELSPNYELSVYQKDGEALDPGQLSGGERALFNLALRTAIYRLLAEGIEGAAPMPPLILDEPTVFLDSGHVSRLVDLVESMRELGVEQIVVVSHDEELVGAADDLLTVEKDPTTNRSSVSRAQSLVSELEASAD